MNENHICLNCNALSWGHHSTCLNCGIEFAKSAPDIGTRGLEMMQDKLKRQAAENSDVQASPLQTQEGGDHYKSMKIQPVEYIHANNLGYCEGAVIKYVSRYKSKNGAEDLRKAIHFLQILLDMEYGESSRDKGAAC